jgi:hypothetical protein
MFEATVDEWPVSIGTWKTKEGHEVVKIAPALRKSLYKTPRISRQVFVGAVLVLSVLYAISGSFSPGVTSVSHTLCNNIPIDYKESTTASATTTNTTTTGSTTASDTTITVTPNATTSIAASATTTNTTTTGSTTASDTTITVTNDAVTNTVTVTDTDPAADTTVDWSPVASIDTTNSTDRSVVIGYADHALGNYVANCNEKRDDPQARDPYIDNCIDEFVLFLFSILCYAYLPKAKKRRIFEPDGDYTRGRDSRSFSRSFGDIGLEAPVPVRILFFTGERE